MSQSRTERFRRRRRALVDRLAADGDLSQRALDALLAVERHRFVPHRLHGEAYENHPLPIGMRQTISQPFMVGWLVDAVHASPGRRILEIGTGCGYQAAVMAAAGAEVWSIEVRPELARRARATLDANGFQRVRTRIGDGCKGWPEEAPFDGIVLTAAPEHVPEELFSQVAEGGELVAPVGRATSTQLLIRFTNLGGGEWGIEELGAVRFVPLVVSSGRGRRRGGQGRDR